MASTKTCQGMVISKEGATAPAAAPAADLSPACLVALRPAKGQPSGTVPGTCVSSGEAKISGKHKMYPAKVPMKSGELKDPTSLSSPPDVSSPDCVCGDVKVTLDNNGMWHEFYKCRTEMISTKQGSRMFPYCRFRLSGLQSSVKYSSIMDVEPLDNSSYKWTGESWQACRKAERHVKSKPFIHPDSPATGQHWMQSPVSFYKSKLTNNSGDQEGNIISHPMHRYLPQSHSVQADKAVEDVRSNSPNVLTFTFPQTEFITVTTYQNPQFTQSKVNYNPFVKKSKEDRVNSCDSKLKGNLDKELNSYEGKTNTEQHPVKKSLKILSANHKPRNSKASDFKLTAPKEPQEKSATSNSQSAATIPTENPSSSRQAPRLISESICEAHVSSQRCQMEQGGGNHSNSSATALSNTMSTTLTDGNKWSVVHKNNLSVTTSSRKSPSRNLKDSEQSSNSSDSTADARTACSAAAPIGGQLSSNKSQQPCTVGAALDGGKQQKRPARSPLPALALFLKQHSTKSKKVKNSVESAPPASSPESCSSHSVATAPSQETSVKDAMEDCRGHDVSPDEMVSNVNGEAVETTLQPPNPSGPDPVTTLDTVEGTPENSFVSVSECLESGPMVPDHKALITNPENTLDSLEVSTSALSTCSTSESSDSSLHLTTALSLPDSPKAAAAECSTLPSGSRSMKMDSSSPDPQCSSFDFDPLSPASSPEPLPPLPASLALESDSATSGPASTAESFEDPQHSRSSSVFKWHTVLPSSGTYTNSCFTALQPQQQSTPVMSVTQPLLSCLPEPQSVNTPTAAPPKDPLPSFQESEQSSPFPAESSPLALQLPSSPTFSSLDEDGLSPSTSLSESVHFFSTDDDIGVEFSNADTGAVPGQPLTVSEPAQPSVPVQSGPTSKPSKRKKSSRTTKSAMLEVGHGGSDYRNRQPRVEEVEEQLFVSFTSKEALKLHTAESPEEPLPEPVSTPEPKAAEEPESSSTGTSSSMGTSARTSAAESVEEAIMVHEENLLRDLKSMKHRQVIHPVSQEVGLKMTLSDPASSIDSQYSGVRLPIPPSTAVMKPPVQPVPTSQGVFASFQSRTGKTTDVTQIKGWKEKFTPLEAEPTSAPTPEAGPSADLPKKNSSAFCSDMSDEYSESEGKSIDERASSFSQPPVEAPAYQLPVSSTSYVSTSDHISKKPTAGPPASDIISGFIPPSKRPRPKDSTAGRRTERKQRWPKQNKPKAASAAPQFTAAGQMQDAGPGSVPGGPPQPTEPSTEPTIKKRRRLKPRASSQTLSASVPMNVSEDMAPSESDSESKPDPASKQPSDRTSDTQKKESRTTVTRSFARSKESEDSVKSEGHFQTSITEERATVALMSLFTQTGFVRENPTAPIRSKQRPVLPCSNEFCRLGCVCPSLSHCSRVSHCGRPSCMFGCSCLKQKVVLLKNSDSSDSSPTSSHGSIRKKKKRRRMMKMAYVSKEADSAAHPVERVRTSWRRNAKISDPEPVHSPDVPPFLHPPVRGKYPSSCARVRGFIRKTQKPKEESKEQMSSRPQAAGQKCFQHGEQSPKPTDVSTPTPPPAGGAAEASTTSPPSSSQALHPKPSKRLSISADCKWGSDSDRSYVLKKLCEAMASDLSARPFWIRKYLITPIDESVDESSANKCIQYKVQITAPNSEVEAAAPRGRAATHGRKRGIKPAAQDRQAKQSELISKKEKPPKNRKNMMIQSSTEPVVQDQSSTDSTESVEDWQKEVMEEDPMEDWQKEVMEEDPMEDWQKEVEPLEEWQKEVEPIEDLQKEVEPIEDLQKEVEPLEDWQKEVEPIEYLQKEVEPLEDWQKNLKVEPLEDFQKEVEPVGDLIKKVEHTKDCQKEVEPTESKVGPDELNSDNKRSSGSRTSPLSTGVSPAGFLSANKKQLGVSDDVIQVSGKQYPLAKIQLGAVGALHPANRSAAHLTGWVDSQRQQQASSSSKPSCILQNSPDSTSSASSVPPTPAAPTVTPAMSQSQPLVTQPTLPTPPANSEPQNVVAGSSNPSQNSSPPTDLQPSFIQVPNPPKVTHVVPARVPRSPAQRMSLKPVRSSSGIQYYQTPDGRSVQSIPTNQSTPVNPSASIQKDPSTPCAPSPPVAVVQRPTVTSFSSPTSSVVHSSIVLPYPAPEPSSSSSGSVNLSPPAVSVSQQNACAFTIVPPQPGSSPIFIKLPYSPPTQVVQPEGGVIAPQGPSRPTDHTASNPPVCEKSDSVVSSVAVTGGVPVKHQGTSPPSHPTIQTPAETSVPRVSSSPPPDPPPDCLSPEKELALDPTDSDVVCVDTTEVVDSVSSSETEDSSDFCESDSEDKKQAGRPTSSEEVSEKKTKRSKKTSHDYPSRLHPPAVAAEQADAARKEAKNSIYISSEEDSPNRTAVTNGAAAAAELAAHPQSGTNQQEEEEAVWDSSLEENGGCGAAQQKMETTSSSDTDSESESLSSEDDSPNSPRTQSLIQRSKHRSNERKSRAQMHQMFQVLQQEVVPTQDKMSKIAISEKAIQSVHKSRRTEEDSRRKKRSLEKRRDVYSSVLAPCTADAAAAAELAAHPQSGTNQQEEEEAVWDSSLEENGGCGAAQQKMETTSSSDTDSESESLSSEDGSPNSPRTQSLIRAPQEVQKLPEETEGSSLIRSLKKEENQDTAMTDNCSTSGTEKSQHQSTAPTNQAQNEMEEREQIASKAPRQDVVRVAPPAGEAGHSQTPPAPPCQPAVKVCAGAPSAPTRFSEASGSMNRTKTVPNISSRSRNQAPPLKVLAESAPKSDSVVFVAAPGSTPLPAQVGQPSSAAAPSPLSSLSAGCSQVGVHSQAPPLSPAGAQRSHLSDGRPSEPARRESPQDSDESSSALLSEIVFLNQQAVVMATTAQVPSAAKERPQDSSEEQKRASHHPEPTTGNATEGVSAPPPSSHMKVRGAKAAGVGTNEGSAAAGRGGGGVAWRPMPRSVPSGSRGNSPS